VSNANQDQIIRNDDSDDSIDLETNEILFQDIILSEEDTSQSSNQRSIWTKYVVLQESQRRSGAKSPSTVKFNRVSGPINIPTNIEKELDVFKLFYDSEIINEFVQNTNLYGAFTEGRKWKNVNEKDIFKLFAIILYMGITRLPQRHMYWSRNMKYNSKYIGNIMSRERFCMLLKCFHYVDTSSLTQYERASKNKSNPFWTVESFTIKLAANYRKYYQCDELIDIDEMCIPFQGRHICLCFNPNKPEKWHLKAFGLNDTKTGYLSNFYLYKGREEERPSGISASLIPTMKLTNYDEYKNRNHNLATDNWYSSIETALYIKSIGMDFVGTIRLNRSGLPKNKERQEDACFTSKRHERGEITCHETTKDGIKIYFTAWMDSKPVHVLSTYAPEYERVGRNIKDKDKKYKKISLHRPTIIGDYNRSMGGTDKHDQLNSYYRSALKTVSWQPRLFSHFLISTCTNSAIIFRQLQGLTNNEYNLLNYIDKLIDQLVDVPTETEYISEESDCERSCHRQETWLNEPKCIRIRLSDKSHIPVIRSTKLRKECVVCRRVVTILCKECEAHLCINEDRDCWTRFHMDKVFDH
jgi:hypothetical protein